MLALLDADYKFLFIDLGASGRCSDGDIFSECNLWQAIEIGTVGLPDPNPLPSGDQPMPYFIVADDMFPLRMWLMKPYPHCHMSREESIFNYQLSRTHRVVENAFGILAHRWE